MPFILDENLKDYSTERQWEILTAVAAHGSERSAAKALGIARSNIYQAKASVLRNAARHGYAPDHDMVHTSAPGFKVKGTSTLYDAQTGEARIQWVKTDADKEAQEAAMREAIEAMSQDIPRAKPIKPPKQSLDDLLNLYVITDYHHGMRAWARETGQDNWDLDIAQNTLVKSFANMMAMSPDAETGFICQLGDFLHSDFPALTAETSMSGHSLDTDGRAEKVIETAIRVLRQIVDMALHKHDKVHVLMAEGNHDLVGSIWLRAMFAALYENEPRITVDQSPLPYYAYQHGETALFFHHGHQRKLPQMPGVFAAQFGSIWGECSYRYAHTGHYHSQVKIDTKEDMGCTVTQHRTLSAKDSYAARGGYFAERKAECVTYHKKHGIVASNHVTPEMIDA
jgi:hypothetical protein